MGDTILHSLSPLPFLVQIQRSPITNTLVTRLYQLQTDRFLAIWGNLIGCPDLMLVFVGITMVLYKAQ